MENSKIPLCVPDIDEEEIREVSEVLKSGWLVHGPKTKQFEEDFAKYIGAKKAISVNSCTSALQLVIQALGLKGEIIVPSFTFVASANAIVTAGCKPVFCDIDYYTCNIDVKKIEDKITDRTCAIMPVHYAGQSCDMDKIMEIAKKHNLIVIEDSAECIGGTYDGKKTGSFGIGCFSFFPTKNMTTGEGGMITLNDEKLAEKIKALSAHGILSSTFEREKKEKPWFRVASYAGYNYRMSDIQSVMGLVQMKKLEKMNDLRRNHAEYLNQGLRGIKGIILPLENEKSKHVYQMYTIKIHGMDRNKIVMELRKRGIEANVHFDPPVHLQPYYIKLGYKEGDFPITEKVSKSIITLPMYPGLKKEQLDYMIKTIKELVKTL